MIDETYTGDTLEDVEITMTGITAEIRPMKRPQGLDPKKHPEPLVGVTVVIDKRVAHIFYVDVKKGFTSDDAMLAARQFVNGVFFGLMIAKPPTVTEEQSEDTIVVKGYVPEYPDLKVPA